MGRIVFALAVLAASVPAGAQTPGRDRDAWIALARGGFTVPPGTTAAALLTEMNALLGSPDPVLRDEVAYSAAERWILRDRLLSPDEVRAVARLWTANLHDGLGAAGGDLVYKRSFSALCLSIAAAADLRTPIFDAVEVNALYDTLIDYFARERDLRGYDAAHGWMHSVAHTSDALKFLLRNPKLARGADRRAFDAVRAKIESAGAVFTWGENDRMAAALQAAVSRADADRGALPAWIDRWTAAFDALWANGPLVDPAAFARVENARQVMRALYTGLAAEASPSAAVVEARGQLLAALTKMR